MSASTKIEWTGATWNPVTGCAKVSHGCKRCYAERDWQRLQHLPRFAGRAFTDVACHPERLDQPLRWLKPRRIFVNSMSDLFHEDVPDEFIDRVFAVMALSYRHTFQVLTKRPGRMLDYMMRDPMTGALRDLAWKIAGWRNGQVTPFPRHLAGRVRRGPSHGQRTHPAVAAAAGSGAVDQRGAIAGAVGP